MPQTRLSKRNLFGRLGREWDRDEIERVLFRTKMELGSVDDETLTIEVTHDRLDLLSESGVSRLMEGLTTGKRRLGYEVQGNPAAGDVVEVDPAVVTLRGEIAMAKVEAPSGNSIDNETIEELVRNQELLHSILGENRRRGSIGLYPMHHLSPPFFYSLEPLERIRFTPLSVDGSPSPEVGGRGFFSSHPMAEKFGSLGRSGDSALTLRDSRGNLLSLPPILNSAGFGEVSPGDTAILIESTGTTALIVKQMVGYMLLPFVDRGWRVSPVGVKRGGAVDNGTGTVSTRVIQLTLAKLSEALGRPVGLDEAEWAILASGLTASHSGPGLSVAVPPWRPDLLGEIDLVEEVVIALGLDGISPVVGVDTTRGRRLPFTLFSRRFHEILVGMGYQEVHTPLLISKRLMESLCETSQTLEVTNPVSEELSVVRPSLLPGLVFALASNSGERYPQMLYELSEVVVRDGGSDTGTDTHLMLAAVDAGSRAGLARAMAVGDRLTRIAGMTSIREASMAPGAIAGRVAHFKFAGERIAIAGELHPAVLSEMKIQEPVSWIEMDLSRVWKLRGGQL